MHLLRARDVSALDAAAAEGGIATHALMERAGAAVARTAARLLPGLRRAWVLVGPGNNGGDGYVAARLLAAMGVAVEVAELHSHPGSPLADRMRRELLEAIPTHEGRLSLSAGPPTLERLQGTDLVVDALLGAVLSRPAGPELASWFELVRQAGVPVLAIDVPSGLDADLAVPTGPIMQATWTLQLGAAKPASLLPPARSCYGQRLLDDLDLPADLLARHAVGRVVDTAYAGRALPRRREDGHKYQAGTVLVVGGSAPYAGAAELAARAALRAGAGYVVLATPERHPASWPELVALPWDGSAAGFTRMHSEPQAARTGAWVVGPGLQTDTATLLALLRDRRLPTVLDGGALLPAILDLAASSQPLVLTPHAGEAARLLGRSSQDVTRDPLAAAAELADRTAATVVLKGPATVVAAPGRSLRLVEGGPAALATAGTGDVLAGVIGALLSAGWGDHEADGDAPPEHPTSDAVLDRVAAAVAMHAEAGRLALRDLVRPEASLERHPWLPSGGLVAGDVVAALPAARAVLERAAAEDRAGLG